MKHSFDGLIRLHTAVERISELKERYTGGGGKKKKRYTGMNDPN